MVKQWTGNTQVNILNVHGNRDGEVIGWHEGYRLWQVKILSGRSKGETQCFLESNLIRK